MPPLHHIVVEGGRVPAVAALSLIGLFPQRGAPQRLPEAVAGRGTGAAVVDGGVVVGVGGGRVDALVVSVGAEQVVVVEVRVVGVLLLDLNVVEHGGRGGQRGRRQRRRQRREGRERRDRGRQRGGRWFWVMVGVVLVVLVVQLMVVVLGKVMRVLDVRPAAVDVVHVHYVRLVVLRLAVEDGGQVRVRVGVLESLREWVGGQGPG